MLSSSATAQSTISTTTSFANNNGTGTVTFNLQNTNGFGVIITDVEGVASASGASIAEIWYKTTPVNGAPGAISAANGWTLIASQPFTAIANTTTTNTQPFLSGLNFILPANTTWGFAVTAYAGTATRQRYYTHPAGTSTHSAGGVNLITGTNIGYGGGVPPTAPGNHPRGWIGKISFIPAIPCTGTPVAGPAVATGTCPVNVTLQNNPGVSNLTYQWQMKDQCGNTWTDIPGATNLSYPVTNQPNATEYRVVVTCTGSGLSDVSGTVLVNSVPPCYCASAATSALYEDITNVTVGSLNNSTPCVGTNGNTYSNFTSLPPLTLLKGATVPYSITISNCGTVNHSNGTAIFIDYNRNGTFEPTEKVAFTAANATGANTFTGSFIVSPAASSGVTGMRVINSSTTTGASLTGCDSYTYGETEDYLVNILYAPQATGAGVYCSGDTVRLVGSAPGITNPEYIWTGPGGQLLDTSATLVIPNIQTGQSGNYTLRILSYPCGGGGTPDTSGPQAVNVTVNQRPNPPIVAPLITYCQFDKFDTIPIFGQNLVWYSVATGGTGSTVAPVINTNNYGTFTYYVSQNINGCESQRAPVTFNVVPKPAPPTVISPVVYCQGEAPAPLVATGQNIRWYNVPTGGAGTSITPTPGTNAQGTFTWYVSQTVAGCESERVPVEVKVNYVPNALITMVRDYVCQYDTISLGYFGNADSAANYLWTLPTGAAIVQGSGQGPVTIRFDSAGLQRVRLQVDNGGCVGPVSYLDVPVRLSPVLDVDVQDNACEGEVVNVAISYSTTGIDHHEWDFQGGVRSYGAETSGPYGISWPTPGQKVITVVATDNECKSLPVRDTIDIRPLPAVGIGLSKYDNICAGDTIAVRAPYDANASYQWLPSQYFRDGAGGHEQMAVVDQMGYIYLNVTNEFNCRATDSVWVQAQPCCDIFFPDAFTPNNDGRNDRFRIIGRGKHHIVRFAIQNRWGQTVFETYDDTEGWDGTFNGKVQDMGTYFYYIKYQCQDGNYYEDKGELMLIQ